jgi:hypothetical protein
MEKIYLHCGHESFVREYFMPIKNIPLFVKPQGGLWGSPINTALGWSKFVEQENFGKTKYNKCYFKFRLNTDKILIIEDASQLDSLPHNDTLGSVFNKSMVSLYDELDFEQIATKYDAMEVLISNDYRLYERLYGWDVDSVLVFNPDVVEVI